MIVARAAFVWLSFVAAAIVLSTTLLRPSPDEGWQPTSPLVAGPYALAFVVFAVGAASPQTYLTNKGARAPLAALLAFGVAVAVIGGITGLLLFTPALAMLALVAFRQPR